jgi:C-terminal peptidase prc
MGPLRQDAYRSFPLYGGRRIGDPHPNHYHIDLPDRKAIEQDTGSQMSNRRKLVHILFSFSLLIMACQAVNQLIDNPYPLSIDSLEERSPLSTEQQVSIFDELWNIVNEEYLYEDFNGVDWEASYQEYHAKIETGLDDEAFYQAMREMIFALNDEHSVFLSPEEALAEDIEYAGDSNFVGIGIWVEAIIDRDRAVILLVFPGSPAEDAGLKSHDSILAVEGEPILDEAGWMIDNILGPEGTPVNITVQSPGGEPRDLSITRAQLSGSLPVPNEILTSPRGQRIGYILIPTLADGTMDDRVKEVLEELSVDGPLDGLILDNRLNGGGYNDVMENILEYFTDDLVGHFVNREEEEAVKISANDIEGSTTVPLVVLVGWDTASFGEIFSGILKDQGRATLIGETTYGNVETLWGYDFEDGSRAWIAHDTFRPNNHPEEDWEKSGIIPDIIVAGEWDLFTFENDPVILAALEHFDN